MVTILGYKRVDYVNKQDKRIAGYKYYVGEPMRDGIGLSCDSFFIDDDAFHNYFEPYGLNDCVELCYNKYGRVVSCTSGKEI